MLFMKFKINGNSYLLTARDIIEVVPYANLQKIPKAPAYLAGLMNYRGGTVPVVDICLLMCDKPSQNNLSSRIAMVDYRDNDGQTVCIGLLIEHLTETVEYNESDFSESGVKLDESPYLDKVVIDDNHIIQLINIHELIPESAHDILFSNAHAEA